MPLLKNIFLTRLRTNSKVGVVRFCAIELWNKLASYMSLIELGSFLHRTKH